MAKQLNYTHPNGTSYPESYWVITRIFIDIPTRYAKFDFTGFKDAEAREDGREPISYRSVELTGDDFDVNYTEAVDKVKNFQEIGYEYSAVYKDSVREIVVQEGKEERIEKESYAFFAEAIDV